MIDAALAHPSLPSSGADDVERLRALIAAMGGLAEAQLERALAALRHDDREAARAVVAGDAGLDAMEHRAGELIAAILLPGVSDAATLREVLAAHRIAGLIERVGDYAKTVARRLPQVQLGIGGEPVRLVGRLGGRVRELLRQALDAFAARDADAALAVCAHDREVDQLYRAVTVALTDRMMTAPGDVPACSELLLMAKTLERVGDQATNIAELVFQARRGHPAPDRHAAAA